MRRAVFLLLPLLLWVGFRPDRSQPAAGETQEQQLDRSTAGFFAGPIVRFDVKLPPESLRSLQENGRKAVPATVVVGTNVFEGVAVHVKGAAGSTRSIDDNPALTLNFGKPKGGEACFGLRKLHLNNSVQDPSRMDELIAGALYRRVGIPTARATQVFVTLDGRDLGLYVLKEGYDKTFIRRFFPSGTHESGNLYDGGFVRDIDQDLERLVGTGTNDHADLRMLRDAVDAPVATRLAKTAKVLDIERFTTFCAIQSLSDDWDGYARNRNNYRLYHDPVDGRFHFIPHGMDQLFANPGQAIEPGWNGLVAQRLSEVPGFRMGYLDRVAALSTNLFSEAVLTNIIDPAVLRLRTAMADRPKAEQERLFRSIGSVRRRVLERGQHVEQLIETRPKPVRFDERGEMFIGGWLARPDTGNGVAEVVTFPDRSKELHLRARSPGTSAGFRTALKLPAGGYTLSARVKTRELVPMKDPRGEGAGLRLGGASRTNHVEGTTDWTPVVHRFELPETREVEFVAEIRADAGEAWFDFGSLKITREKR